MPTHPHAFAAADADLDDGTHKKSGAEQQHEGPWSSVTTQAPLLHVEGLHKSFAKRRGLRRALTRGAHERIQAVEDVTFDVFPGEVVGLAGESGSGKSVTGELIAALQGYDQGRILFEGQEIALHNKEQRKQFRRQVSMVFQDPYEALNPRMTVLDSVTEPLRIHRLGSSGEQRRAGLEILARVGLRPAHHFADEYPHQLSGGERQRAAVARALITRPKLLIADEPTTMLDVSVRTGLLNLLREITREQGLAMVFVSHDFTTLEYLCDRIVIIYLGRVAEIGPASEVLEAGLHPYTHVLSAAIPVADPDLGRPRVKTTIDTELPSRLGCLFAPRCPHRMDHCTTMIPALRDARHRHSVACHLYREGSDVPLASGDNQSTEGSAAAELGTPLDPRGTAGMEGPRDIPRGALDESKGDHE